MIMIKKSNFIKYIDYTIKLILLSEIVFALLEKQWITAILSVAIMSVILSPIFLQKKFNLIIPKEFEITAILFIFAALFLGEIRGYYSRFWWWDILLHTTSGFLLGIFGYLLVYILNESREIEIHMTSLFVSLFAFFFAVGIGALWEIFEFGMDTLFGFNMQKPMLGDPSGLTDTMWDLIVDTIGALCISISGYIYLWSGNNNFFMERWINSFIDKNPRFFEK